MTLRKSGRWVGGCRYDEAHGYRWLLAWEEWSLWGLSARVLAWLLRQGRSR